MATLVKRRKHYYSKISVRVGKRYIYVDGERKDLNNKKSVYIKLLAKKYSEAKTRNSIVTKRELKLRGEIRQGLEPKSKLLTLGEDTDWSWNKNVHTRTTQKILTIREYVNRFISYKKNKKAKDSTIDSYGYALNRFIKSVGEGHLIADTEEAHIDLLIEHMNHDNLTESSMDSNLKSVSSFLNWCQRRKYISSVPIIELFRPILKDKWLTESEYNALLNFEYSDKRFNKIFKLYGETGMRLQEGFHGVLTEDENGIWLAIPNEASKSGKGRTIELNEEQRDTIKLMQTLWIEGGCRHDHIKYYSRKFAAARKKLGIGEHKSFHSLRHYFGKTMLIKLGNIYMVSGLLGHSSVKVTEDSYVKGFDMKSSLRDFPSLKKYLKTSENEQNNLGGTSEGVHQSTHLLN